MSDLARIRLLQLVSPALPVGAYSYSQGLEWAIEQGWVKDEATAGAWIGEVWRHGLLRLELPLLVRSIRAWAAGDAALAAGLNEWLLASRESRELYAETAQMGYSLTRLIDDLRLGGDQHRTALLALEEVAFPTAWAFAATALAVTESDAVHGYAYSWLENQVMAALKAVPLGQVAGQRLLLRLGEEIAMSLPSIAALPDEALGAWTPGLAIASSLHETQYSRLFRS